MALGRKSLGAQTATGSTAVTECTCRQMCSVIWQLAAVSTAHARARQLPAAQHSTHQGHHVTQSKQITASSFPPVHSFPAGCICTVDIPASAAGLGPAGLPGPQCWVHGHRAPPHSTSSLRYTVPSLLKPAPPTHTLDHTHHPHPPKPCT